MGDEKMTPRERRLKLAETFTRKVEKKEARRIKGRTQKDNGLWFGLGVAGVVGWSVAMRGGLGCLNAWDRVKKARENIIKE